MRHPDGSPAVRVEVAASSSEKESFTGTTDNDGTVPFVFNNLPADELTIHVNSRTSN